MSNGYKMLDKARLASRRKCGWGRAITNCNVCGRVMVGHNRGVCSKCLRAARGDNARVLISGCKASDRASALRTLKIEMRKLFANGGVE